MLRAIFKGVAMLTGGTAGAATGATLGLGLSHAVGSNPQETTALAVIFMTAFGTAAALVGGIVGNRMAKNSLSPR